MAQEKYKIDMSKSYFIGDRWKDMKAGYTAGVKGLFVDFKYNEKPAAKYYKKFSSLYKTMIFLKKEIQKTI
jgi:D-glycero-D-manno-heptose 1,7-bisphosphate phosphatase